MGLMSLIVLSILGWADTTRERSVDELLEEGVRLHDAGRYEEAIRLFEKALEKAPDNPIAIYELSYTHMANQDWKTALRIAKKGLKIKDFEQKYLFYVVIGSSHSSLGRPKKALAAYEKGLALAPDEPYLHFNKGITLLNMDRGRESVAALEKAAVANPAFSSPFYWMGYYYAETGYKIPGLLCNLRFLMLEPTGPRAANAIALVLEALGGAARRKSNNEITVTVDPGQPTWAGDFGALDTMLALSAAASMLGDEAEAEIEKLGLERTDEKRALTAAGKLGETFAQVCLEADHAIDAETRTGFVWQHAAEPVLALHEQGVLGTLISALAVKHGLEADAAWFTENKEAVDKLNRVLSARR